MSEIDPDWEPEDEEQPEIHAERPEGSPLESFSLQRRETKSEYSLEIFSQEVALTHQESGQSLVFEPGCLGDSVHLQLYPARSQLVLHQVEHTHTFSLNPSSLEGLARWARVHRAEMLEQILAKRYSWTLPVGLVMLVLAGFGPQGAIRTPAAAAFGLLLLGGAWAAKRWADARFFLAEGLLWSVGSLLLILLSLSTLHVVNALMVVVFGVLGLSAFRQYRFFNYPKTIKN